MVKERSAPASRQCRSRAIQCIRAALVFRSGPSSLGVLPTSCTDSDDARLPGAVANFGTGFVMQERARLSRRQCEHLVEVFVRGARLNSTEDESVRFRPASFPLLRCTASFSGGCSPSRKYAGLLCRRRLQAQVIASLDGRGIRAASRFESRKTAALCRRHEGARRTREG